MTNPSDASSSHGQGRPGPHPAGGSWPAYGAPQGGAESAGAPQHGGPGYGGPPAGAPGQPHPPGGPGSPRTGPRTWHPLLAAGSAPGRGGAAAWAGGLAGAWGL